jgi:hypothetical protein
MILGELDWSGSGRCTRLVRGCEVHRGARGRGSRHRPAGRRRGSTGCLSPRVGLAELDPVLFAEAVKDRPALKAAIRPLVPLAGVRLVPGKEADLDQDRESAAHPGFREAEGVVLGQGSPVDWEGAQEPLGAAPEPRDEMCECEAGRCVLAPLQRRIEPVRDGARQAVGGRRTKGLRRGFDRARVQGVRHRSVLSDRGHSQARVDPFKNLAVPVDPIVWVRHRESAMSSRMPFCGPAASQVWRLGRPFSFQIRSAALVISKGRDSPKGRAWL